VTNRLKTSEKAKMTRGSHSPMQPLVHVLALQTATEAVEKVSRIPSSLQPVDEENENAKSQKEHT
jgi:hypothetical protein